jgi:hypothetical protein
VWQITFAAWQITFAVEQISLTVKTNFVSSDDKKDASIVCSWLLLVVRKIFVERLGANRDGLKSFASVIILYFSYKKSIIACVKLFFIKNTEGGINNKK